MQECCFSESLAMRVMTLTVTDIVVDREQPKELVATNVAKSSRTVNI